MKLNPETSKYWDAEDVLALEQAKSMEQLCDIAFIILRKMPQPIGQVCGPIGSGGAGSVAKNLEIFNDTVVVLQTEGKIIFDQMPFEDPIQEFKKFPPVSEDVFIILDKFYLPIFESGLIKKVYFMKGWESSNGAKWEHEQAQKLGIEIEYL